MLAVAPLVMLALTVAVPAAVGVSVFPLSVAIPEGAVETNDHAMVLFVALAGFTVPVSVSGVPAVAAVGTPVMPVTATNAGVTVMLITAVLPFDEVTVMDAVPALSAVTTPLAFTVATGVLLLLHVTDLLVASVGETLTVSVSVPPAVSVLVLPAGVVILRDVTSTVLSLSFLQELNPSAEHNSATVTYNNVFFILCMFLIINEKRCILKRNRNTAIYVIKKNVFFASI